MFICSACLANWTASPSTFGSHGKCEMCDKVANCSSIPSRYLFLKPSYVNTLAPEEAEKLRRAGIVDTVETRG